MNHPAHSVVLLSTLNTFWASEQAVSTCYQLHQVGWIKCQQAAVRDQLVSVQQLTRQIFCQQLQETNGSEKRE